MKRIVRYGTLAAPALRQVGTGADRKSTLSPPVTHRSQPGGNAARRGHPVSATVPAAHGPRSLLQHTTHAAVRSLESVQSFVAHSKRSRSQTSAPPPRPCLAACSVRPVLGSTVPNGHGSEDRGVQVWGRGDGSEGPMPPGMCERGKDGPWEEAPADTVN